ncbi:hydroxyethylthiazole kinase [Alloscardovia macacae]|uniref:Hydroxyethylthiazole kinase n=1 Tax=Alloscardovia macacae TaxID=1160091 RepID=A0A261F5T5_9BIFI|nr:hydroxyethylthiazole kinase [Alloscardovia macacae]OZG54393.1 hydroxyethylthiazole kinase [Alloscardovia macacae]
MLGVYLDTLRQRSALVHNITNNVTVNDVANMVLACGASPIMSDGPEDVYDITSICSGLNINIGTLNSITVEAMSIAGRRSAELGHPTLLDPVGAGASRYRDEVCARLLSEIPFDVIRGNVSEIKSLAGTGGTTKGVDADAADAVTDQNLESMVTFAKSFAAAHSCVVAITGAIDLVADADTCYVIRNGRAEMSRITGTGCQLSGLLASFISANSSSILEATAAAVCAMGVAGEIGWTFMQPGDGNATYRNRIIDAMYHMTGEQLDEWAKYEIL